MMERYWQDLFEGERALRQALEKQLAELRRAIEELALEFAPELSIVYPEDVKRLGERIREKIESAQEPWRSKYFSLQKELEALKHASDSVPVPECVSEVETHPRPTSGVDIEELKRLASSFKVLPPFNQQNSTKAYLFLAAIGSLGLSGRPRLSAIVAEGCGLISPKSGSIQRALMRLVKYKFIKLEKTEGAPFSLVLLTERGKEFYEKISGRKPVQSEGEMLLRTHTGDIAHTAYCVWVRELAEAAGYKVIIPAPARTVWAPDLIFEDEQGAFGVEVERGLGKDVEQRKKKWLHAQEAQGFAAVVAPDPNVREMIKKELQAVNVRGKLTDISYLLSVNLSIENFWAEEVVPELLELK